MGAASAAMGRYREIPIAADATPTSEVVVAACRYLIGAGYRFPFREADLARPHE